MRHGNNLRTLGRRYKPRMALIRGQLTALINHERIVTTIGRAKELRRVADKAVTMAKKGNEVGARAMVYEERALKKLINEVKERYALREGGYTRVMRMLPRVGDNAPMAVVEFVDRPGEIRPAKPVSGAKKVESAIASEKAVRP